MALGNVSGIVLKHSLVLNDIPTPAELQPGEIALNANSQSLALYTLDETGSVRGFDSRSGSSVSNTAPTNPAVGQLWTDTSVAGRPDLKTWDGTTWNSLVGSPVSIGATAPNSAVTGDLWLDISTPASPVLKTYDGAAWIAPMVVPNGSATQPGLVRFGTSAEVTAGTAGVAVDGLQLQQELASYYRPLAATDTTPGLMRFATPAEIASPVKVRDVVLDLAGVSDLVDNSLANAQLHNLADVSDTTVATVAPANGKGFLIRDGSVADGAAGAYKLISFLDLGSF